MWLGGLAAIVSAVSLVTAGATFGLFSSSETQTASSFLGATFSPSTAPVPTAVNETPSTNTVGISWQPVTLSDSSSAGTVEYTVIRSTGKTVCSLVATTTCTDPAGVGGTHYTYTEEAFYVVGRSPTWSLGPSAASAQITFPETPSFSTTLAQPGSHTVGNSWSDSATVTGDENGGPPDRVPVG